MSQQKLQQWQYIDSSLANPYSSYRVKLGVLSALSGNNCADLPKLSAPALQTVAMASRDSDPALRDAARHCLAAQASTAVDSALDNATKAKPAPTTSALELAKTQLEVLYALGRQAKDRYGSRQAATKGDFEVAERNFQKSAGAENRRARNRPGRSRKRCMPGDWLCTIDHGLTAARTNNGIRHM